MLLTDFFTWWYTKGWKLRLTSVFANVNTWQDYFSIGILLKTLFAPWRQNVSYARADQSINLKISAITDNLVSRFVGFFVRITVLFVAIITLSAVFIVNVLFTIIWPILPFGPIIILVIEPLI